MGMSAASSAASRWPGMWGCFRARTSGDDRSWERLANRVISGADRGPLRSPVSSGVSAPLSSETERCGQGGSGEKVSGTTLLDAAYPDGVSGDRSHREEPTSALRVPRRRSPASRSFSNRGHTNQYSCSRGTVSSRRFSLCRWQKLGGQRRPPGHRILQNLEFEFHAKPGIERT